MNNAPPRREPTPSFFQRPPWNKRRFWFTLSGLILVADYLCGPRLLFPIFFIFPVMLAGWNCARREAIAIALCLTAGRFCVRWMQEPGAPMAAESLNSVVRGVVLVTLAVLVSRVAEQNARLARRLKKLEGLLPICAHCKRILDEEKHWTRLETYIVEHSQAEFTHGICPACAKEHYGLIAPNENSF